MTLKINPKFKNLFAPLSDEAFAGLERDILATNGPREPIVIWNGIIVDGHNRYAICQKHGLPFTTREESFSSEAEAIAWMIKEQFNRRNMSPVARTIAALNAKEALIEIGRQKQSLRKDLADYVAEPHNTRKLIAEKAGVSESYVYQVDYVLQHGDSKIQQAMISEEMNVKEAYTKVRRKDEKLEQRKLKREEARQATATREQSIVPSVNDDEQTSTEDVKTHPAGVQAHPVGVQPRAEKEQPCPADEQPITQPNDLPRGMSNENGFIRHCGSTLPDTLDSFPYVYKHMKIAAENFLTSMEMAFQNYTAGMVSPDNEKEIDELVSDVIDSFEDISGRARQQTPSIAAVDGEDSTVVVAGEDSTVAVDGEVISSEVSLGFPTVGIEDHHLIPESIQLDDTPESFPYVMDLVQRALNSFVALIQNAMSKLSPGMLTNQNKASMEDAIRAASYLGMKAFSERMIELGYEEYQFESSYLGCLILLTDYEDYTTEMLNQIGKLYTPRVAAYDLEGKCAKQLHKVEKTSAKLRSEMNKSITQARQGAESTITEQERDKDE